MEERDEKRKEDFSACWSCIYNRIISCDTGVSSFGNAGNERVFQNQPAGDDNHSAYYVYLYAGVPAAYQKQAG